MINLQSQIPNPSPPLPIPDPLRGRENGTWAHDTVTRRLPEIARRVLAENDLPAPAETAIRTLIAEIPTAPIRPLTDLSAPDAADWARYIFPHSGLSWLDVPWYFAEAYFYRRIIEATGYFLPGDGHARDPFRLQKRRGLDTKTDAIQNLAGHLNRALADTAPWTHLSRLLHIALWGNRADLSLWPAGEAGEHHISTDGTPPADDFLLIDDTAAVIARLRNAVTPRRIDFLCDNAGFELVCDLALADFLLTSGTAQTVVFHLKAHPTFVSDALAADVRDTITFLETPGGDAAQFSRRLAAHLAQNRLQLRPDFFWNSPLVFWEMPAGLRRNLSAAQLVISKGDANYRRLLGDCHWAFDTPFAEIARYFPAPLVALRTLKAEVAAGLPRTVTESLSAEDPDWLTNGKRGVIQFVMPPK